MLEALARWSYRHRWPMVGLWVALVVGVNVVAAAGGGEYSNDFSLPGTESQAAYDLLKERFPQQSGDTADAVFRAEAGIDDPGIEARIERTLDQLAGFPHVVGIEGDPVTRVSADGTTRLATVRFDVPGDEVPVSQIQDMVGAVAAADGDGLDAELGGMVVAFAEFEEPGGEEAVGFLAAVLILLLAFGSVLAMGLPLLPAVLGFVGSNIDRWHVPRLLQRHRGPDRSLWFRKSRVVQRHPAILAALGLATLVALALPVFSLRLGAGDAGTGDPSRSSRRAYDLLSRGFGPGFNGPLLLVAELSGPEGVGDLESLREEFADNGDVEGIAATTPAAVSSAGDVAVLSVFPTASPQDPATSRLVHRLRDDIIPEVMAGTSTRVLVGGLTAGTIDFSDKIADRLPWLIGVVLAVSFLLLVAVIGRLLPRLSVEPALVTILAEAGTTDVDLREQPSRLV